MKFASNCKGSIAVEFALIAPVLILLYIAIIETSVLTHDYQRVVIAAEAGAQAAIQSLASETSIYDAAFAAMGKSDTSGFTVSLRCLAGGGWYYSEGTVAVDVSYVYRPASGLGSDIALPLTATAFRTARPGGLCST
jgi:Flp pilus assembly protein TadG